MDLQNYGKTMAKKQTYRVVRRVRFDKCQTDTISRLHIQSLDAFARMAVYEKLERDFKIKVN